MDLNPTNQTKKVLVDQLREKCLEEKGDAASATAAATTAAAAAAGGQAPGTVSGAASSSSQQAPEDWSVDPTRPW